MKILNAIFVFVLLIGAASFVSAQTANRSNVLHITDAYTVLIKEKAKAKADLYETELNFTMGTPQVKRAALRLTLLNREIRNISQVNAQSPDNFSAAYGDLILAKIQTEVELFSLRERLTPEHISVKKKEVELASFNNDLKQINKSFR